MKTVPLVNRGLVKCKCGCGGVATLGHTYINGHNNFKHRQSRTPEYYAYMQAQQRCTNPRCQGWKNYGARGIKFLFTNFEEFIACLGPRPKGRTLDRKNNDGNYEPGNVHWSTWQQQLANRRSRFRKSGGTSKYVGVFWSKNHQKWVARVTPACKMERVFLGLFDSEEKAIVAIRNFKKGKLK
jgi:hypothetical protein